MIHSEGRVIRSEHRVIHSEGRVIHSEHRVIRSENNVIQIEHRVIHSEHKGQVLVRTHNTVRTKVRPLGTRIRAL